MGTPIQTDFGDILQAFEDDLVAAAVVTDSTQIVWAVNDNIPQFNKDFDIVLHATTGIGANGGVGMDGGSLDMRIYRLVDVRIRSESIADPLRSNKTWVKQQFTLAGQVMNVLGNNQYLPKNPAGQQLTVCAVKVRSDLSPQRHDDSGTWGDSIMILEVRYLPIITPVLPVLP